MRQQSLRPGDVVVALQLSITPGVQLQRLADDSGRSIGEVHNAIARLNASGLVDPVSRRIELEPFIQFVRWGVPFAFPPATGGLTVGMATARTVAEGPTDEPAQTEFVWSLATGVSRGESIAPLHPRVPEIAGRNPVLRTLLSLVDLVRVGGTRERNAAMTEIERLLQPSASGG